MFISEVHTTDAQPTNWIPQPWPSIRPFVLI